MTKKKRDKTAPVSSTTEAFEQALEKSGEERYVFRLFVSGMTPNSRKAIDNVKKMCEEYLEGRCELEIIDIYQQPEFAKAGQIIAAPTLVRELPLPLRRFIGNLSQTERIIVGLDLRKK